MMEAQKNVLLLVGSAKRPHGNSESLGDYLCQRLAERGFETETQLLYRALRAKEGIEALLAATDRADVVVFTMPLYVDCLPALVIRAMELIAAHRQGRTEKPQRLVALLNCGFPEARHNDTALAICRQFAREAGFEWTGGLALGGGEALGGRPLAELGGMMRHAVQALNLAAEALAAGQPVPEAAVEEMAQPFIPAWTYTLMGGFGWRQQAKKHGAQKALHARPYQT
jgi:hypothetical protein